jgi:hypothetical protein
MGAFLHSGRRSNAVACLGYGDGSASIGTGRSELSVQGAAVQAPSSATRIRARVWDCLTRDRSVCPSNGATSGPGMSSTARLRSGGSRSWLGSVSGRGGFASGHEARAFGRLVADVSARPTSPPSWRAEPPVRRCVPAWAARPIPPDRDATARAALPPRAPHGAVVATAGTLAASPSSAGQKDRVGMEDRHRPSGRNERTDHCAPQPTGGHCSTRSARCSPELRATGLCDWVHLRLASPPSPSCPV